MIAGGVPSEIGEEGAAIRATIIRARPEARAAAEALRAAGIRRIHVIGNGTSYHSALAAATAYRRLARADEPTVIALTAGEFRNYLPDLGPADAIMGISASGEFRDVLATVGAVRGRIPTIGIVHVEGSTLARTADHVVRAAGGPSTVPVMTKTFVSTLAATHLVLGEVLGGDRADLVSARLAEAADHTDAAVAAATPLVEALAASLADAAHTFVIGSGNAAAAALEAALKLKEQALVHAEGAESWELASGAATIIRPGMVVIALAPNGPGRAATLETAGHAAGWGARIIEVGPPAAGGGPATPGADLLPVPAATSEDYAPLTVVAPVALLGFALARRRGLDPDRPDWIERYHRQGLRHIVTGLAPADPHVTLHMLPAARWRAWQAAPGDQRYLPDAFEADGFIHCTDGDVEMIEVANRYLGAVPGDFVVLSIDLDALDVPWRYDDADGRYPHVYGALPRAAVAAVATAERDGSGRFIGIGLPASILPERGG